MLLGIVASADIHEDPDVGRFVGARDVAVACVQRADGRLQIQTPAFRREEWSFVHEGEIEDIGRIRRRVSARRALQITGNADAESLFAFVLTCIDAHDDVDEALLRATSDIASAGVRGVFDFIIAGSASLHAYRMARPMALLVRSDAVLVASDTFTNERWGALTSGTIVRIDRGPTPTWRFVTGSFERDMSEPELPFTD